MRYDAVRRDKDEKTKMTAETIHLDRPNSKNGAKQQLTPSSKTAQASEFGGTGESE